MKKTAIISILLRSWLVALALMAPPALRAFSPDTYAGRSALADGRWVKVSVASTGMHFIPASDLRSWGFSDPTRVRVHGYGGRRLNDLLTEANYTDDLPLVQTVNTQRGVWFYAVGPVEWQANTSRRLTHRNNPYTSVGYYFITQSDEPLREFEATGLARTPEEEPSTFTAALLHETDLMNFGESGNMFFGESFVSRPSQNYSFTLTDRVASTPVNARIAVGTDGAASSTFELTANGAALGEKATVGKRPSETAHYWASIGTFDRRIDLDGTSINIGIRYSRPSAILRAHLDYIELNYTRRMVLAGGLLDFATSTSDIQTIAGISEGTRLWDVTDPLDIRDVNRLASGDRAAWSAQTASERRYSAWDESASMPRPAYVGAVDNQNLHDSSAEIPDMVIFTLPRWGAEAERLAQLHRLSADSLKVMVVGQQEVFNEFASGAPDYGAFRRMLKMMWDRGADGGEGGKLRYVLFFGPTSFDNRMVTDAMRSLKVDFMPSWQTEASIQDGPSYTSDDIVAMLADGSSPSARSRMDIAVGRIPCRSTAQAKGYVDKLASYMGSARPGLWRNMVTTLADNGNAADHMKQTERMLNNMASTTLGARKTINKVYVDSYDIVNGTAVGARNRLYRQLNDGTLLWTYIGHGALESLTAENIVRTNDIDNEMYFRNLPMLYAATCNFSQHDGQQQSGAERMLFNTSGGAIATFSSCRTAYISENGLLSEQFGKYIFGKDSDGRLLTVGEAIRRAKNELSRSSDNHMHYVLFGSPAMRLAAPECEVRLETINGEEPGPEKDITIKARQRVRLTGIVADAAGQKMTDFNGSLYISLYDAAKSVTSKGHDVDKDIEPVQYTYDDQSSLLFQGRDTVADGAFDLTIAMPSEIADNFRPALISFYAAENSARRREAAGTNSDFFVFGTDTEAAPDTIAPVIEYAYLNHESFRPGDIVNEQPMLLASVTDDTGINLSTAGIGHQMTLQLDGKTFYNDVALYYSPFADGTPGGTIAYPLPTLSEGNHELTLRVYDTSGNPASRSLSFYVVQGAKPVIFDIYTDANPATSHANFYLQHNRPDAVITVTFEVYDMMGRRVWSSTATDRSDMFLSAPIQWNLCSQGGSRVTRGIYIYRAIVRTDDGEVTSKAKRVAVSGR